MERVILTTGGTGGHIFPALAVAEELRQRYAGIRILFVGSDYGPEHELATQAGLEFAGLPVRGLLGRGGRAFAAAGQMLVAVGKACGIVRRFAPQVVAGFGSYASFAPMLAGYLIGTPLVLHEQNAIAGMSNRCMGKLARKICLSMDGTQGFAPEKCVLTGNPVRKAVASLADRRHNSDNKHLLVVGGSQGARALTDIVLESLPRLHEAGIVVKLQTGPRDEERARAAFLAAGFEPNCVQAFIGDMAAAYGWADLVLCRSGASTVAELAVGGVPSVLVPFPHATHDHQTCNARLLAQHGAAVCIAEKAIRAEDIIGQIIALLNDVPCLERMGHSARAQGQPHAARAVVDVIEACAVKKG